MEYRAQGSAARSQPNSRSWVKQQKIGFIADTN
jgi:hypothetical protein